MDPDPIDGDQVYAAERLLQARTRRGKQEFLVKWKGWNSKHNTWEPRENILDERLIQEFEQRTGSQKPAVKRRGAAGAPPSSAAANKETSSSSAVELGPPPPKRGRRPAAATRAKTDTSSDVSTPSTSVGTRRSSRRSSAVKESRESSIAEKAKAEEEVTPTQKESEPEKAAGAEKDEAPVEEKKDEEVMNAEETEDEKSADEEEKGTGEEQQKGTIQETEPKVETPLEIFVEHTKKSVENTIVGSSSSGSTSAVATAVPLENGQPAPSTNNSAVNISGSQAKTDNSTFIITNESDQSATHKIQVYTLSDSNGDSNEEQTKQATKGGPSGAVSKTESHQHDEEDDDEEDIMVLKEDNNGHGSVAETVGSSDELTGAGGSGPTTATNGPNSAETVVTGISSSSVSVTEANQ